MSGKEPEPAVDRGDNSDTPIPQLGDCFDENKRPTEMKRAAAKQLIERYYYQLTDGCGDSLCDNVYCASSGSFRRQNATRNELAILAIDLYKSKANFCGGQTAKVPRQPQASGQSSSQAEGEDVVMGDSVELEHISPGKGKKKVKLTEESVVLAAPSMSITSIQEEEQLKYLTEERLRDIITQCETTDSWSLLIRTIGEVFSCPESLVLSFRKIPIEKEEIREREGDDKDTDEKLDEDEIRAEIDQEIEEQIRIDNDDEELLAAVQISPSGSGVKNEITTNCDVDVESLQRSYEMLLKIPSLPFQNALSHALTTLAKTVQCDLKYSQALQRDRHYINIFVIIFELPLLSSPEFVETVYPVICRATGCLNIDGQIKLMKIWSTFKADRLVKLLESIQQLVTVRVINGESRWGPRPGSLLNDDETIASAVKVMKIVFYASLLGGCWDDDELIALEKSCAQSVNTYASVFSDLLPGATALEPKEPRTIKPDVISTKLDIIPINCRTPIIPYEEFVNEPLNDALDVASDYAYYRAEASVKFSFMEHSFILTTASKHMSMYYDNRMRMLTERRTSLLQAIVHGNQTSPYLKVGVRRDHIIADSLVALELVAMDNPGDLKKQLIVEFEGEQGLDEGGISKEFFQLIVEQMFNPDFGMFTFNEHTQQFWFNPTSFENDAQFMLIGIILGLAIYNNAILDVHFPFVVYRKLLGKLGTFDDLHDFDPVLRNGLGEILASTDDIQSVFMQTFQISYSDIFGSTLTHDLKPGGDSIPVTAENRQEFVDLYADFLLNKSIAKQFRAFKHGFTMVTNESPLESLFRPEEIELLVCGSKKFDFLALEQATEYDGGFIRSSRTVRNFWEVVHEFSDEQKRKLLQFTTGTDRVPIGGLAKLKLIVARNGPDSDRLPTSHTCFNVLLLPDYATKDKLQERLLKAMTYSKGFGML